MGAQRASMAEMLSDHFVRQGLTGFLLRVREYILAHWASVNGSVGYICGVRAQSPPRTKFPD